MFAAQANATTHATTDHEPMLLGVAKPKKVTIEIDAVKEAMTLQRIVARGRRARAHA